MNHIEKALQGNNEAWKYLVIILASLIGAQILGSIPLMVALEVSSEGGIAAFAADTDTDLQDYGIDPAFGLMLLLLPFVCGLSAMVLLIRRLHGRSFAETVNGTPGVRWDRVIRAALLWLSLYIAVLITDYILSPGNYAWNFRAGKFFPLLAVALVFIPLQTTFEELVFRGYLMQGLSAAFRSRIPAFVISSAAFGFLHSFNPEISEYGFWNMMPQYLFFGFFFGLLTLLDDGAELAIGAHAANNIFGAIFVTFKSSTLQTEALLIQENIDPGRETVILVLLSCIFFLWAKRKYGLVFSVLNKRLVKENLPSNPGNIG